MGWNARWTSNLVNIGFYLSFPKVFSLLSLQSVLFSECCIRVMSLP
jgi:hypothetical protein